MKKSKVDKVKLLASISWIVDSMSQYFAMLQFFELPSFDCSAVWKGELCSDRCICIEVVAQEHGHYLFHAETKNSIEIIWHEAKDSHEAKMGIYNEILRLIDKSRKEVER